MLQSKKESTVTTYDVEQDCGVIPTIAVALWLGWMGFIVYTSTLLAVLYFWGDNLCNDEFCIISQDFTRKLIVGWITTCALSISLPGHFPSKKVGQRMAHFLMNNAEKYFGLRTTFEDEDSLKTKSAIYALEPHDMLPFSIFVFSQALEPRRVPGPDNCGLMTSAVFSLPFIKQVYTWIGGQSVDKKTFRNRLIRSKSLSFIPGGVQEVTLIDPNKPDEVPLFLKSRKGFIKIALEMGSPIVPCYAFGLDGSYDFWVPKGKMISNVSRSIGFVPLFFFGRFGIPMGIPKPHKIHIVFGKPIEIAKEEKPSADSIEKYHQVFLREMESLFEKYKESNGYGDKKLKIV